MSRSGYSDDCDGWALIRWRGAVESAIRGQRGQAMLRELVQALDALPEKCLAADSLVNSEGDYCAFGALGLARGMDLAAIDPEDSAGVARAFGVSDALAREVMHRNDDDNTWLWVDVEFCGPVRPHYPDYGRHTKTVRVHNDDHLRERWQRMKAWAAANLKPANVANNRIAADREAGCCNSG